MAGAGLNRAKSAPGFRAELSSCGHPSVQNGDDTGSEPPVDNEADAILDFAVAVRCDGVCIVIDVPADQVDVEVDVFRQGNGVEWFPHLLPTIGIVIESR